LQIQIDNLVSMNRLQAKGNWNIAKGKAKQALAAVLEDADRDEAAQKDERVGRKQKRVGTAKEK